MRTTASLVKLIAFAVVTLLAFGVLAATIANVQLGAKARYTAIFTDATGLQKGDDVRIAGVRVGEVKSIGLLTRDGRSEARVGFEVLKSSTLTQGTDAVIRYRNLIGQRFVALTEGTGSAAPMRAGATIPVSRPNRPWISTSSSTASSRCSPPSRRTTSTSCPARSSRCCRARAAASTSCSPTPRPLTSTLADRDQVIGQTITNLNDVLGTVAGPRQPAGRPGRPSSTGSSLVWPRTAPSSATHWTNINALADQTADLLVAARPPPEGRHRPAARPGRAAQQTR